MTDPVRVNSLRAYIERIENIEAQKRGLSDEIAEQYASAKTSGLNPKAMRKLVAERRRKTDAEVEADLEMYRAALAEHGSLRKAAEALGVSKSKLHRTVPREKNGTAKVDVITPPEVAALPTVPPHDAETGELVDDGGEPVADVPRETAIDGAAQAFAAALGDDATVEFHAAPGSLFDKVGEALEKIAPGKVQRNVSLDAVDPGPIPECLRRERATA